MEHASRSPNADPSTWPGPSFDEGAAWVENATGPPNQGLRAGLLVAFAEMAEWYDVSHETEEDRLLAAITALSDMLEEGNMELSWLIAEARHKGVTWTSIAGALGGLTRQAAHRRFGPLIKERLIDAE